ncbi:MAG TPA: hypothetical protein VGL12_05265 [Roseiarcus sp.]
MRQRESAAFKEWGFIRIGSRASCGGAVLRNDGARASADAFIIAGDLIYTYDNLTGLDKNDPQLVPIGLATGSQSNLLFTSADMLKAVGGEHKRVIPVHEDRLKSIFLSRTTAAGLHVVELALADGETSRVA